MKNTSTKPKEKAYVVRERKASWWAALSGAAWGVSMGVSSVVLTSMPGSKWHFGIFLMLVTAGIGLIAIVAYIRLINALDEMQRKIWIETMALTFGLLWVAFGCLIILEKAEINYIDSVEIGLLAMLAAAGTVAGSVRMFIAR